MRGYSTSKAFGRLFDKSPKVACVILSIILICIGIFFSQISDSDQLLVGITYSFIVIGVLILAITVITSIIIAIKNKKMEEKLNTAILSTGINQVDLLSPYEFEDWIARFLNLYGYDAFTTKRSGDFGADVIAEQNGNKYVISCKKYTNGLGVKCVQEIIGAMDYYGAQIGWVMSTAPHFSKQAFDLAATRGIKLYTKNDLAIMLKELQNRYENISRGENV